MCLCARACVSWVSECLYFIDNLIVATECNKTTPIELDTFVVWCMQTSLDTYDLFTAKSIFGI